MRGKVGTIKRVRSANAERDSVHDDGETLSHLIEYLAGPATSVHEVFRNDLKPIHPLVAPGSSSRTSTKWQLRRPKPNPS